MKEVAVVGSSSGGGGGGVFPNHTPSTLFIFFFHIQGERNEKEECYVYGVLFHAFFFLFSLLL